MVRSAQLKSAVGFRHVIEDGLTVLQGKRIAPERREFVLGDLNKLFKDAKLGSELVGRTTLFVGSANRSAFESFSLLDQLGQLENEELQESLLVAQRAINGLRSNTPVSEEVLAKVRALLEGILATLKREGRTGIADRPRDEPIGA